MSLLRQALEKKNAALATEEPPKQEKYVRKKAGPRGAERKLNQAFLRMAQLHKKATEVADSDQILDEIQASLDPEDIPRFSFRRKELFEVDLPSKEFKAKRVCNPTLVSELRRPVENRQVNPTPMQKQHGTASVVPASKPDEFAKSSIFAPSTNSSTKDIFS